jgi:hypothetical protein
VPEERQCHCWQQTDKTPCPPLSTEQPQTVPVTSDVTSSVPDVSGQSLQLTMQNFFQFCDVTSIDSEFQRAACDTFNLKWFGQGCTIDSRHPETLSSQSLQRAINSRAAAETAVRISPIIGDGNCLFRALSLALTGSQSQHALVRSYVVNHMMEASVQQSMQSMQGLFARRNDSSLTGFHNYLLEMQKPGTWGTEQEIISAAHLFNCSIVCYSQYGTCGQFCLQHFSPHFVTTPVCTDICSHHTLYLVNRSGSHYETATVLQAGIVDTEQ